MKKTVFLGLLAMVLLAFGLFLSGCATDVTKNQSTSFNRNRMVGSVRRPNYTVLGSITMEKDWHGILGLSIPDIGPITGIDLFYLVQWGGVTYANLLAHAKSQYPNADAVIDINIERSRSNYFIFYAKRTDVFTGIAIRYSRGEVDPLPSTNRNILQSITGEN